MREGPDPYVITRVGPRDGGDGVQFGLQPGTEAHLGGKDEDRYWVAARGLLDGRWHHVAVVRSGRRLAIHLDGACVQTREVPEVEAASQGALTLGNHSKDRRHGWKGELQDVRVYARALEPEEIEALAGGEPG